MNHQTVRLGESHAERRLPGMLAFIKESRGCALWNLSRAVLTTDHRGHAVDSGRTWRGRYHYHWPIRAIGNEPVDRHPHEFLWGRRWPVSTQFGRVLSSRYHATIVSLSLSPSLLFFTARLMYDQNAGTGSGNRGRQFATGHEFEDTVHHFCRR